RRQIDAVAGLVDLPGVPGHAYPAAVVRWLVAANVAHAVDLVHALLGPLADVSPVPRREGAVGGRWGRVHHWVGLAQRVAPRPFADVLVGRVARLVAPLSTRVLAHAGALARLVGFAARPV